MARLLPGPLPQQSRVICPGSSLNHSLDSAQTLLLREACPDPDPDPPLDPPPPKWVSSAHLCVSHILHAFTEGGSTEIISLGLSLPTPPGAS